MRFKDLLRHTGVVFWIIKGIFTQRSDESTKQWMVFQGMYEQRNEEQHKQQLLNPKNLAHGFKKDMADIKGH